MVKEIVSKNKTMADICKGLSKFSQRLAQTNPKNKTSFESKSQEFKKLSKMFLAINKKEKKERTKKLKEGVKFLKAAHSCQLKVQEKKEEIKDIQFQHWKQMQYFCELMAVEAYEIRYKKEFLKYAKFFSAFADLIKKDKMGGHLDG